MPLDRLRSPRGSHSRRLTSLTDFEFRVWDQYQLSSDDFGVMRCTAITVMADNANLENRPMAEVQAALDRLITVGLVEVFEHQGKRFICQRDWDSFQKVEFPRRTDLPKPPDDVLERCDTSTRALFDSYPGGFRRKRGQVESVPDVVANHLASGPEAVADESASTLLKPLAVSRCSLAVSSVPVVEPTRALTIQEIAQKPLRLPNHRRGSSVFAGSLPKDHAGHSWCGTHRICVPTFLHSQFVKAKGGDEDDADRALRDWYVSVESSLPDGPVPTDTPRFWRARFDAAFVTVAAPVPTKVHINGCFHQPMCESHAAHTKRQRAERDAEVSA